MGGGESPLALSAEEMRALGYRTVDLLVERLAADRGFRALKVWMSLQYLGVGAFRAGRPSSSCSRPPRSASSRSGGVRLLVLGWQLVHRLAQTPAVAEALDYAAKARLRPARA